MGLSLSRTSWRWSVLRPLMGSSWWEWRKEGKTFQRWGSWIWPWRTQRMISWLSIQIIYFASGSFPGLSSLKAGSRSRSLSTLLLQCGVVQPAPRWPFPAEAAARAGHRGTEELWDVGSQVHIVQACVEAAGRGVGLCHRRFKWIPKGVMGGLSWDVCFQRDFADMLSIRKTAVKKTCRKWLHLSRWKRKRTWVRQWHWGWKERIHSGKATLPFLHFSDGYFVNVHCGHEVMIAKTVSTTDACYQCDFSESVCFLNKQCIIQGVKFKT